MFENGRETCNGTKTINKGPNDLKHAKERHKTTTGKGNKWQQMYEETIKKPETRRIKRTEKTKTQQTHTANSKKQVNGRTCTTV